MLEQRDNPRRSDRRFSGTVQFGAFHFSPDTGELRRGGLPLRLENQPARLLAYLIEHRDRLVPRAEAIQWLWPDQEHGDFDHRLDKAVAKLRSALNDGIAEQRFVKTVRGRGLRFVAAVTCSSSAGSRSEMEPVEAQESTTPGASDELASGEGELASGSVSGAAANFVPRALLPLGGWRMAAAAAAAALLLALLFGWKVHEWARARPLQAASVAKPSVMVLGVNPAAGPARDNWISLASAMWLADDLQENCGFRVVPSAQLSDLQAMVPSAAGSGVSRDGIDRIRDRTGADYVVFGTYALQSRDTGPVWQLDLWIQDTHPKAHSAEPLLRASVMGPQSDSPSLVQSAQQQLCAGIGRGETGDKNPGLDQASLPANDAAARLYAEGLLAMDRSDLLEAQTFFSQVVALDPNHAAAHAQLARVWTELGKRTKAEQEYEAALSDSHTMTPRQQTELWALRCEIGVDWATAVSVYRQLEAQYPENLDYRLRMATDQIAAGQPMDAVQTLATVPETESAGFRGAQIELLRSMAEATSGSYASELEDAARAERSAHDAGQPLLVARALRQQASAHFALGHWSAASQMWQQAANTFEELGDRRGMASVLYDQGRFLWERRQPVESRRALERSVELNESLGDSSDLAASLAFLANVRMYSGADPRDADTTAKPLMVRANQIYQENGDIGGEGVVQGLLGDLYMCQSQFDSARSAYMAALALSRKVNDRSRIANRLLDLGIVASELADNSAAIQYYNESIAAYQELGQQDRVSLVKNRLANVLFREAEIDRAIALSQEALQTEQSIGFFDNGTIEDLSRFEDEREPAKAEALARQSLQESNDKVDSRALCVRYMVLAEAQTAEGKLQDADASIRQAFAMNMVLDDWVEAAEMLWARAEISRRTGRLPQARADLQRALRISRTFGSKRYEMPVRLSLAEVDIEARDPGARSEMEQVERDSERLGYHLLSQKAKAALQSAG